MSGKIFLLLKYYLFPELLPLPRSSGETVFCMAVMES
jgi:hypothetical protein